MKITNAFQEPTALLILDNATLTVSVDTKAEEMKLSALNKSAEVLQVSNVQEQEIAVAAQISLDTIIRLAEKSRKAIKAPVIDLGKTIDGKKDQFCFDLEQERTRITKLLGDFQQLELAKVRAAEAATRLELESIERKRQEELCYARSLQEMDDVQERFNEQAAALANKPVPVAAKAEGQVVKNDWDIVVTDPYKLARYHPQCVTITAKVGEIKQLLQQGITVNGVTATPIVKSGTRSSSAPKLIEV